MSKKTSLFKSLNIDMLAGHTVNVGGTLLPDMSMYDGCDFVSQYLPQGFRSIQPQKNLNPIDVSQAPEVFEAIGKLLNGVLTITQVEHGGFSCGISPECVTYTFVSDFVSEAHTVMGCFPISGSIVDSVETHLQNPTVNCLYYAYVP